MQSRCAAGPITLLVPLAATLLVVGCAQDRDTEPTPPPATVTATVTTTTAAPEPAPTSPQTPPTSASTAPTVPAEPAVAEPCSDDDLTVTSGQVESDDTMRRVVVSFTNASSDMCTLTSYPAADLVGGPGNVLVHVARRPANAAPRLELLPGEVATADVQSSAIDTASGAPCGRIGTLVVTPPDTVEAHLLEITMPICDATISSVG